MTRDTDRQTELEGALKEGYAEQNSVGIPDAWRKNLMLDIRQEVKTKRRRIDPFRQLRPFAVAASFVAVATGAYAMLTNLHQLEWMCLDFVWNLELIYFWL